MKHARIFAAVLVLAFFAAPAFADESSIYGSYTHVFGLHDTKSDARVLCYSGLVKSLCQRVAAGLARDPAIVAAGLTRQDLVSGLPFLLRVEVMGESFGVHGDDISVSMNGRAAVDAASIAAAMSRMKTDPAYRAEVDAGLQKFAGLENELRSRQARIAAETAGIAIPKTGAVPAAAAPLAAEPGPAASVAPPLAAATAPPAMVAQVTASQGGTVSESAATAPAVPSAPAGAGTEIPAAPQAPLAAAPRAAAPVVFPEAQAPDALFTLRSGMSYKDMLERVGAPAQRSECGNKVYYNYANVWVYFSDGNLVGYLLMENWRGPCHPYVGFMGEILYF